MTRFGRLAHPLCAGLLIAVVAACGRGSREPRPGAVPALPAPQDTAAARRAAEARRDSLRSDSVRTDSVRAGSVRRASALAALKAAPPTPVGARGRPRQERRCQLDFPNTRTTRLQVVQDPNTKRNNTFVGGGVVAKCA